MTNYKTWGSNPQYLLGFFIILFGLLFLPAYSQAEPAEGQAVEEKVTLALEDADIQELVRWAVQVTDKTVIIHPNVKGRITVLAGEPMTRDEAYQVFLSALQVNGYAVIETADTLKIIPATQAKEDDVPLLQNQPVPGREDIVVRILKVKNISATEVVNLVKPMVPQYAYMAAYPATNTLIIAERAGKIDQIVSIVNRLDQAGTIDIELIALDFASAREVAEVVGKLLPQKQGQGPETQAIQFAVDERSNSILMTGDPVTRQQLRALIKRLDQPLEGEGNTQVIYLQYAKAEDLVPILESLSGSVQKGERDQRLSDVDINIKANEALNALIITAPPALLNTMKGVIAKMDVRRAQVLVEALIVEVNEDVARDLGILWQTNQDLAENEFTFGGLSAIPSDLTPLSFDDSTGTIGLGSGLSIGYFRGGSLRGIVQALEGDTNANILSTPTILALDNEEAEILVGSNVPFITGSLQRQGDLDPFQTIQRQDIGVTLKIKPRINNSDSVTLEIEQKVESLSQSSVQTADVVTNKREIKTKVLIENDEVLVLGGLIRDEVTETESKVPFLGDIPLLGRAFKSTSNKVTKSNLMVFIHPQILRDALSGHAVTEQRYKYMQENQEAFRGRVERYFIPAPLPALPERSPNATDTNQNRE